MSIRDSYYFALLEVHNGRPISVKTCFKGQQGDLTTLSRTVCRCQKQPDGSLRPEYGFDDEENANCFIDPLHPPGAPDHPGWRAYCPAPVRVCRQVRFFGNRGG